MRFPLPRPLVRPFAIFDPIYRFVLPILDFVPSVLDSLGRPPLLFELTPPQGCLAHFLDSNFQLTRNYSRMPPVMPNYQTDSSSTLQQQDRPLRLSLRFDIVVDRSQ
jgi:hypothetical protein